MINQSISIDRIEYLEKDFLNEFGGRIDLSNLKTSILGEPSLLKIQGMANFWELKDENVLSLRLFMEDIISGLYLAELPLAFGVFGRSGKVDILMGTLPVGSRDAEECRRIIKTSLQSSFQGIELEELQSGYLKDRLEEFPFSGVVTGSPTEKTGTEKTGVEQIERMIRGFYGRDYGYLVLATPATREEVSGLFSSVLNEMRIVKDSEKGGGIESPIAKRYLELLGLFLSRLDLAKSQGLWHTQIFLFSKDMDTLNQVKVVVKSVFGGRESLPEPIRTFDVIGEAKDAILLTDPTPPSPGHFFYPYMFMTTLNSSGLANFVSLPTQEMPGFHIKPYSRFHVSPMTKEENTLDIGEILDQGYGTGNAYQIPVNSLRKHGLIVGTTGSGKTNTLFFLLKEAWKSKIPFLVLEPAKTEYRSLLFSEEFRKDLNVFTLGDNNVSPFRMNPFEIMPGIAVQTHIDLLKSVFNASFYMWGPLPQVLEQCIHEIYIDKGWDLTLNENRRGYGSKANPTLTDLYNKIDEVVDRLGYSKETTMEIKSALKTRINSMRIGGKGLMLDTNTSIPFSTLISKPTVLELDAIGDDEEKSFLMGVMLTRMYEYYVSGGLSEIKDLKHLTVIEEAHRLLSEHVQENPYIGNTRGKAVETFTNILSEIRSYGEGLLVVEQIPTKLAPDVIKNTNLKVMHRIVAADDRRVMGATMNIEDRETRKITALNVGEAVVYSEGDEGAYHIRVPYSKIETRKGEREQEEEAIRKVMVSFTADARNLAPFEGCVRYCRAVCRFKSIGRDVSMKYRYASQVPTLTLALLDNASCAESVFLQLLETGDEEGKRAGDAKGVGTCTAIQGAEKYFEDQGRHYDWAYDDVEKVKLAFLDLSMDALDRFVSGNGFSIESLDPSRVQKFRSTYIELCRGKQPTRFCPEICGNDLCLYRFNFRDTLLNVDYDKRFVKIYEEGGVDRWPGLLNLFREAVQGTILPGGSEEATGKIALCFALQKFDSIKSYTRQHMGIVMAKFIDVNRSLAGQDSHGRKSVDDNVSSEG
jgi:hypothetical protein